MSTADPWSNAPERFLLSSGYCEIAEVIGWKKAVDLGTWVFDTKKKRKPGSRDKRGTICIPASFNNATARAIAEVIGEDAATLLMRECHGCRPVFGSIEPASIPRRNRAIVEQLQQHDFHAELIAASFGLTARQVRNIWSNHAGTSFAEARAAHLAAATREIRN